MVRNNSINKFSETLNTTGDVTLAAGNVNLPTTSSTAGAVNINAARFMHRGTALTDAFLGFEAGNFTGAGTQNTGIGWSSLNSVSTGSNNTGLGTGALQFLTTASDCVAVGNGANGNSTTGSSKSVALGSYALNQASSGDNNIAIGYGAIQSGTSGTQNIAIGRTALHDETSGSNNVGIGDQALFSTTGASNNIAIGNNAGSSLDTTDSSNILIGNTGTILDNNKIRIGTQGAGAGQQNVCFIAGITGVTPSGTLNNVTINSSGQLGTSANTSFTWSVVTVDASFTVNTGTIANKAGLLTMTLPATAAVGDILEITGINTALGWKIAQNANQQIFFGNTSTTLGAGGSLASAATRDSLRMVCVVAGASTVWNVISSVGNITVV